MASKTSRTLVIGEDPDFDLASLTSEIRPDRIAARYDEAITVMTEIEKSSTPGKEPTIRTKAYRKFRYSSLQTTRNIRLLRLSTLDGVNDIRASLEEVSLDNIQQFYALSYTWGSGDPMHPLILGDYIIHIRENLYQALRMARRMDVTLIWIDAICINQENLDERASQVMLMYEIYNKARCVLIDLGGTPGQNPGLRDFLTNIRGISNFHPAVNGFIDHTQFRWDRLEQYGLPNHEDPLWHSLNNLLERPWFTRVWVTQELASAKKAAIVCDGWIMEIHEFAPIFANIYSYGLAGHEAISTHAELGLHRLILMVKLNTELVYKNTFRPLIHLLERDRHSQATNPRDHIYGMLGISNEAGEHALKPDYEEGVLDLYVRAAKYFANTSNIPSLLHNAGIRQAGQELPSWVPCWDSSLYSPVIEKDVLGDKDLLGEVCYKASGGTYCTAELDEDRLVLKVWGIKFDEISRVGAGSAIPGSLSVVGEAISSYILEVDRMLRDGGATYPTGEDIFDVRARILLCDHVPATHIRAPEELLRAVDALCLLCAYKDSTRTNTNDQAGQVLASVVKWLEEVGQEASPRGIEQMIREAKKAFLGVSMNIYRARRAMTRKGYICQVPPEVQQGDVVAIFYGCDLPYVLRPSSRGRYRLIGNCYVHGIMDGEALNHAELPVGDFEIV